MSKDHALELLCLCYMWWSPGQ